MKTISRLCIWFIAFVCLWLSLFGKAYAAEICVGSCPNAIGYFSPNNDGNKDTVTFTYTFSTSPANILIKIFKKSNNAFIKKLEDTGNKAAGTYTVTWDGSKDATVTETVGDEEYICRLYVSSATPTTSTSVIRDVVAPTVSITKPTANQEFTQGDKVDIEASASDDAAGIDIVDFYEGSTNYLGGDTVSLYTIFWQTSDSTTPGTYTLNGKRGRFYFFADGKGFCLMGKSIVVEAVERWVTCKASYPSALCGISTASKRGTKKFLRRA